MKITFLLPTPAEKPSGGAKVIYEYANGLARRGHSVTVIHSLARRFERGGLHKSLTYFGRLLGLQGGYGARQWMEVDAAVRVLLIPDLSSRHIPDGDVIVATAWRTAEAVRAYSPGKGIKYYFVQDYEYFMSAEAAQRERMAATYCGPFRNVVISPACDEMVRACGGDVFCEIPNGLDHALYRLVEPIYSPARRRIGFPTRSEPFKRTEDAVSALRLFRENCVGDVGYWSFGAKRPDWLPDWIEFFERPTDESLVELYNQTSIFLVPSEYEGWGLPGSEAMCCGAALVSTDNGGVNAYATHMRTALLSPRGNPEALAEGLQLLHANTQLRIEIARAGNDSIRAFTWERSVEAFARALGLA